MRMRLVATEQVAWSVICLSVCLSVCLSLCLLTATVSHTKTDEPIEMSLIVSPRVQISLRGMEHFLFLVDTQIRDHACQSVGILSDSQGDAASPHQYCGHLLAFRIVV